MPRTIAYRAGGFTNCGISYTKFSQEELAEMKDRTMTENEAIEVLKDFGKQVSVKADGAYQSTIGEKACDVAIKALEEVQQYRAIGTVEELIRGKRYMNIAKHHGTIGQVIDECVAYEAIGTPEECRAAMERQNPIAAIAEKEDIGITKYTCPACGMYMGWSTGSFPARYCWKCGQKLDWSNEE